MRITTANKYADEVLRLHKLGRIDAAWVYGSLTRYGISVFREGRGDANIKTLARWEFDKDDEFSQRDRTPIYDDIMAADKFEGNLEGQWVEVISGEYGITAEGSYGYVVADQEGEIDVAFTNVTGKHADGDMGTDRASNYRIDKKDVRVAAGRLFTKAGNRLLHAGEFAPDSELVREIPNIWKVPKEVRGVLDGRLVGHSSRNTSRSTLREMIRNGVNEANYRGNRRMRAVSRGDYLPLLRKYRKFGAMTAKIVAIARAGESYDDSFVDDIIEGLRNQTVTFRREFWGRLEGTRGLHGSVVYALSDVVRLCDCGAIEHVDGVHWSEHSGRSYCDNCDHRFRYSECMSGMIHESDAVAVWDNAENYYNDDSPDDWATHAFLRHSADHVYHNGSYLTHDAYIDYIDNYPGDDGDGEDEEYTDRDGLAGYHSSSHRVFVERATDPRFKAIGLELEVYSERRSETVRALREHWNKAQLFLERDGSLDDECGFEIITQPMGKTEWAEFGPKLVDVLSRNSALGYDNPDSENDYGIHISVSRAYLTPLQEARILMFLVATENRAFVQAIAQRPHVYEPNIDIGALSKTSQTIKRLGGIGNVYDRRAGKHLKKIMGAGKYCPVNLKDTLAEFRLFQSTLSKRSFMKNLEFVWALMEWTSTAACTGSSWMHEDFVKWLSTRPQVEDDFPNLLAYLRKATYKIKNGVEISSSWKHLVRPKVRRSLTTPRDELEAA